MRTSTLQRRAGLLAWLALAAPAGMAADATPWLPPPGEYRIDTTSTLRWQTPSGVMERVEQVDGQTGGAVVTQRAPGVPAPVVTRVPGKGPVRECQAAGPPPPVPGACAGKLAVAGDSAAADVSCDGREQSFEFRKLSEGVWEKRIRVTPAPAATQRSLPPQSAAAMAPVIAKMEARAREAPPEEAESLRRQIQAIRGGGAPASTAPDVATVQRWTWLASQCSSGK